MILEPDLEGGYGSRRLAKLAEEATRIAKEGVDAKGQRARGPHAPGKLELGSAVATVQAVQHEQAPGVLREVALRQQRGLCFGASLQCAGRMVRKVRLETCAESSECSIPA